MKNAVLLRDVPLVVRDVSSGGCLIEFSTPLEVGMIGRLEVEFEGERRFEWFRVARVDARGEHEFVAGIEFLPLAAAGADSLRSAIGRFRHAETAGWTDDGPGGPFHAEREHGGDTVRGTANETQDSANSAGRIIDFFRRRS